MNKLTFANLEKYAKTMADSGLNWVRVSMDTGGIAAGADTVCTIFEKGVGTLGFGIEVRRVGSLGYSFADPLVEVAREGMPRVVYGRVDDDVARHILQDHLVGRRLIDDHILAWRNRALTFDGPTTFILVKDTGAEKGDKCQFFQFSLAEELKRCNLQDKVQVVRALDMGVYDEGVAVQFLPSRVTYTNVLAPDVARIVKTSVQGKKVIDDLLDKKPDKQVRVVMRNCGKFDPENFQDYLRYRVYQALVRVLQSMKPDDVIAEMKTSGLRGRGGAGFPTWLKWQITRAVQRTPKLYHLQRRRG